MINLENLRLADILPERLKTQDILAITNALDVELKEITKSIFEIVIMPRIDEMPEDIVDSLAWQLHVDFYEPLGLDLDKKRALVKNSLDWHRRKGTKSVVVDIMRTLFFDDFSIEEWFEYGGRPGFFRAIVGGEPRSEKELGDAMMAIDVTKNVRSWLDYIVFKQEMPTQVFSIHSAVEDSFAELFALSDLDPYNHATLHIAGAIDEQYADIFSYTPPKHIKTGLFIAFGIEEHTSEIIGHFMPKSEISTTSAITAGIDELYKETIGNFETKNIHNCCN